MDAWIPDWDYIAPSIYLHGIAGATSISVRYSSVVTVEWMCRYEKLCVHYGDVRMGAIASQITSLAIVYSAFYSGVDQRKHQSSASLAFVWGIHRDRWIPRTKGQLRGKCFHLMTSSWAALWSSSVTALVIGSVKNDRYCCFEDPTLCTYLN